jgi:hypothetical protein
MNKLISILLTVVALSVACLHPFRWQLCARSFHNYQGERPEQMTFPLDRWTGKVWYATPKSLDSLAICYTVGNCSGDSLEALDAIKSFTRVESLFYPQLNLHYEKLLDIWYENESEIAGQVS